MALGALTVGCDDDGIRQGGDIPTGTGTGTGTGGVPTFPTEVTYSDPVGSCDLIALDGTCTFYIGEDWDNGVAEAACNGTFSESECPPAPIGYCFRNSYTPQSLVQSFYTGDYYDAGDSDGLQTSCESGGGTWTN
jgi:hypothetical protein